MKSFSIKLIGVYLLFIIGILLSDISNATTPKEVTSAGPNMIKVQESIKASLNNKPTYTVIKPKEASEVFIEREGNYVYSGELLSLDNLEVKVKKKAFISLLIPAIDTFERELEWNKEIVKELRELDTLTSDEKEFLEVLYNTYKIKDRNMDRLLSHMIMPPKSIIISQAAIESGWGTSRFFKEGNNLFGVWSYNSNEPRIAAQTRSNGYTPYLKKYESLKGSVEDYILLLSRSSHYSDFRDGVKRDESSVELARYLVKYSELGDEYIKRVVSMINSNNLMELD